MASLAVKYRPKTFEEAVGQQSTVTILKRQIELKQYKNAYIFCGASGCGKTTLARCFANAVNKYQGTPIEIDAASNNGVDNIRLIVDSAKERSLDCEYKFVILDEAHQLTTQSWNALLKIIEEPPKYTIFIFCTTEPNKIPQTIQNRCQKFTFTKISNDGIFDRLRYICNQEGIRYDDNALDYIVKLSNGGMRDAINNLEKVASYSDTVSIESAINALGTFRYDDFFALMNNLIDGKDADVLSIIDNYYNSGNDLLSFVNQFFVFAIDLSKYIIFKNMSCVKIPAIFEEDIKKTVSIEGALKYFDYVIENLLTLKTMLKNEPDILSTVEVMFLKVCRCK